MADYARLLRHFSPVVLSALLLMATTPALSQKTLKMGSAAMEPTIQPGDTVHMNLFAYFGASPKRWDVVVYMSFDNKNFWVSRVVGIPGDTVEYDHKKVLRVNGTAVTLTEVDTAIVSDDTPWIPIAFVESLGQEKHTIRLHKDAPPYRQVSAANFVGKEHCAFGEDSLKCKMPDQHYFVMGDNRNNAIDSRYFGFIHESRIGARVERISGAQKP